MFSLFEKMLAQMSYLVTFIYLSEFYMMMFKVKEFKSTNKVSSILLTNREPLMGLSVFISDQISLDFRQIHSGEK